ncbi:penicillin-insensitive murein endopeptidase [Mesorhizobium sp. BE184]|uniref:penicillin-insensitive murein endopeptidase n=1 Tax=Mesorhizobium sp. BE184 TaxID=2817714 RepID=UPI0028603B10|nr:penicillin-insensitive murein endopeptidase [Mesorhizobium sp. BE184]MDR7033755.1 penicillin-insensitive murein endopeptidase [Mesorhizobium sp. BE184]
MKAMMGFLRRTSFAALGLTTLLSFTTQDTRPAAASDLAKTLFGSEELPSLGNPQSYGFYSKGCFSGGVAIATDGPTWQAMRLSRNRRWGHPAMIALIEKFSRDAVADGWPGLLLGDISQPRGGPMLTGHASHQIGLDADIWFTPMPDHRLSARERENMSAVSMVNERTHLVKDKLWTSAHTRLLRRAASYPEVERILVNPGIKKKLCDTVTGDRSWLNKVRPFWGHDYHFHVRIGCQPGSPGCKPQQGTGTSDGCDKSLAWWFTEEPWRPNKNPDAPKARDLMTMASLPKACQAVLDAPGPVSAEAVTYPGGSAAVSVAASPGPATVQGAMAPNVLRPKAALPLGVNAFAETPDMGVPLPRPRPTN